MKTKISTVSMAAIVLLSISLLFVASASAKKHGDNGSYIKPTITAEQAISSVKAALPKVVVGKSFVKTGERGQKELEVTLALDGKTVSRMRLNPGTGEIMPEGQEVLAQEVSASTDQAVKIVQQAIPNLEVASVRLGRHGEWKVDLTLKNAVVASISVHSGDGSILPDWKAESEETFHQRQAGVSSAL
jgi:hypothetical protein